MAPERPGPMTRLAILNITFGFVVVLLALAAFIGSLVVGGPATYALGEYADTFDDAFWANIAILGVLAAITAWGAALFASGVGLMRLAPWGRWLSIGCGVVLVLTCGLPWPLLGRSSLLGWSLKIVPLMYAALLTLPFLRAS